MSAKTVLTDWRGNEIRVGDTVLYPRSQNSSASMAEAVVEEIVHVGYYQVYDRQTQTRRDGEPQYKVKVRATGRCTGYGAAMGALIWLTNVKNITAV